jgi:hypothetical protein
MIRFIKERSSYQSVLDTQIIQACDRGNVVVATVGKLQPHYLGMHYNLPKDHFPVRSKPASQPSP